MEVITGAGKSSAWTGGKAVEPESLRYEEASLCLSPSSSLEQKIKNPDPHLSFNELIPPRGHRGGCHSRKWGSSIEAGPSPSWVRAHGDLTNQKQVLGVLTNQRLVFTRPGHVFKTRVSVIEHVPALDTGVQMDRSPDVVDHLDLDEDDIEHHEIQDKR